MLLDLNKPTSLSPQEKYESSRKLASSLEEDTRFSHPIEVQKRKRSGYMVRSRHPTAWQSPSTASTSSLAQLHEKLASLPQYKFDKEAVHVCALPELSTVTEVSETDDRPSLNSTSTFKINRPFGVCYKSNKSSDRNSQSDGEVHNKSKISRYLSPAAKDDDHSTSCLLVATIGSDESVINDTLERLTKNKNFQPDNIVDLLVQEALQKDNEKELRDSGINTGDNKKTQEPTEINNAAIDKPIEKENTDVVQNKPVAGKTCTVISNTTTDESNDVVYDTPLNFVNVRKRNIKAKVVNENRTHINEGNMFNVEDVEQFFSQHISENNRGEIVISPTLARKINETSSESEQFEDCLMIREDNNLDVEQIDVYDIDIIECLNSIVDKVCNDFEKCAEILNRETTAMDLIDIADMDVINPEENVQSPLKYISNIEKKSTDNNSENIDAKETSTKQKSIKLTFNTKKTAKTRANARKKKNKLELEIASNMSPVKKAEDVDVAAKTLKTPERVSKSPSNRSVDLDTALIRRKRKLYSPKDESKHERVIQVTEMDEDKDFKTSKVHTPKYKATSYKDIEMDRQKRLRQPRNRKSTAKTIDSPSPRTKKMNDIFNNLKSKVECPDTLTVVDKNTQNDLAVYNFTSDSEDEDFKQKKIEVQKRISSTTVASGDSISTRVGRSINRVNYSETKSSDETNKKSDPKKKRTVRRKKTQPKSRLVKPINDMIDEKMRKNAPEELNTSLVLDKPPEIIPDEPKLTLPVKPQMEPIPDDTIVEVKETNEKPKKTTRKNKRTEALSLKKEKNLKLNTLVIEKDNDDRTISPLPGLNVETIQEPNNDANDSVSAKMLQKFKEIYQDGPEAYINETNTTQNLLSDIEHINYSPTMNITDEFNKAGNYSKLSDVSNEIVEVSEKPSKKKTNAKNAVIDLSENYDGKADSATILRVKKEKAVEKKKAKKETQQVINLTKISDAKSEVSIETVGKSPITAHGDSDEQPPNAELLTEKIKPRDLDVEYQNQSVRDYLDKLREVVNESPANKERKDSTDSVSTRVLNTDKRSKFKSPVVSVSRLSLEDISRWLPSRRNSDTDSSYSKATSKQDTKQKQKYNKHVMEKESSSDNDESPVQKIDKISLEFNSSNDSRPNTKKTKSTHSKNKKKIDEEVPSHNESEESIKPNEKHSKKHKQEKYINLEEPKKEYTKRLLSRGDYNKNKDTTKTSNGTVSPVLEARNVTPKKIKTKLSQENRKSLISPIKLFSDFKARNDTSVATSIKKLGSIISNLEKELKDDLKPNYLYKSKKEEMSSPGSSSSKIEDKEISSSTVIEVEKTRKRKSKTPVISNVKRRKAEDTVVSISESGPSVSSVNEWFKRNAPVSKAESVSASIQESIENVMEKLDTTLVEIHQNTSKKFIHMFVEAQKHLNEVKQERRKLYKTVASDIFARVVKVMDEKFTELDKRSQEMDAEFMENLKVQAAALIRDDCRKKQAMVSLLREDLNATLARIDKKKYRKTL